MNIKTLFSKKGIIAICIAVVLLVGASVGVVYAINSQEKFDGNLTIEAEESVTIAENEMKTISCSISYSKAVSMLETSDSNVFEVSKNDVQNGYIELQAYSAGTATLTITAQYEATTTEATVDVVVVSESDDSSDDDSSGTETPQTEELTLENLTSGAEVDLLGEYISVDDNEYFESGTITVSGSSILLIDIESKTKTASISAVYLVGSDGIATKLDPYGIVGGTEGPYCLSLEHAKKTLLVLADVNGTTYYVTYELI